MYTESVVVASRTEDFKLEVIKRMPHDFTKPYYVIKINDVVRIQNSTAEDVAIALVGVIESLCDRLKAPKVF